MNIDTGLQPIGQVPWGSHFCHFFRDSRDLVETLVPFFKTGIESGEACLWVTAEPFSKQDAIAHLGNHFHDLEARRAAGQVCIFDHQEWYERHRDLAPSNVAQMWIDAKNTALGRGYRGLRVSGNSAFLRTEDWDSFNEYETAVRNGLGSHEIVALCSYQADRWGADCVLDIINSHDFALARRRGAWEIIESASVKKTKDALLALNADLERRVDERTKALSDALTQQTTLTAELSHRVKNTIASVQAIVDQTLRNMHSPQEARSTVAGRLAALGRAHDQLSEGHWIGVGLSHIVNSAVAGFGAKVHLDICDRILRPRAALDLSLVFHELLTNASKYGALRTSEGSITVTTAPLRNESKCELRWCERGGPPVTAPTRKGFGTRLVRELITHDLRGECEIAFEPQGLTCTMRIPWTELSVQTQMCSHGCGL